jgi:hypothetical protein
MSVPEYQVLVSTRQGVLGTASALVVPFAAIAWRSQAAVRLRRGRSAYLLLGTGIERHDHLIHDADIELTREVQ